MATRILWICVRGGCAGCAIGVGAGFPKSSSAAHALKPPGPNRRDSSSTGGTFRAPIGVSHGPVSVVRGEEDPEKRGVNSP